MAQKIHIVLEDDLDGSEASETVTFGLDGTTYEIDLTDEHATELREALAPYVGHARKVSGSARRGRGRAPRSRWSGPTRGS
ncbi:MAG: Lsr2 family protein, partial [Nocardioides sp.]|nr:Lsr2 family protein [Nocardioides sp.]